MLLYIKFSVQITSLLRKVIKISKISPKNTTNLNEHLRKYGIIFTEIFCYKLGEMYE